MGLSFQNLDAETRRLMIEEIDIDIKGRGLYVSNYLNISGATLWPNLLRTAAAEGTDDSLAEALRSKNCFKEKSERKNPKGGTTMAAVPHTAAQTLAESQFNMYFMRALARRAVQEKRFLIIYRAKDVFQPREGSEKLIGSQLSPELVLDELRKTKGVEPSIGIPLPNSGLTVKLN